LLMTASLPQSRLAALRSALETTGVNLETVSGPEELEALVDLAKGLDIRRVDVMAYHRLGERKYQRLGRVYHLARVPQYSEEEVTALLDFLKGRGLEARLS
ncbi:MAG: hypothetical protein N3E40_03010, partial [Dehalococcoidia bacterium]|nr:hypothetical protein [Dehalococcoidia bacterium]